MTLHIGFIGLGIMGKPMAFNLLKAQLPLGVYARRPESMQPLVSAGAKPAQSCVELAADCDVVFTMVSDTPDVQEVLLAADKGVIHGLRPGSLVVDMSTISPQVTRQMAQMFKERGCELLDAPVSGGDIGARDGTLSIMVGGSKENYERVLPLLRHMGKNIVHIGDSGAGQTAKACNQLLVAQTIAAVAEALIFAKASGVDPGKVRKALMGGFASSRILEVHGQRMLSGNYQPGFKAGLHSKDLAIVMNAAREMGILLPGAAQAAQYLQRLVGMGEADSDSAAIGKLIAHCNLMHTFQTDES
jgi:2-hydroxy-3-oxopropionate reductase